MKKLILLSISFLLSAIAVLQTQSCAVQADPLGGPKDVTPPFPDSIKSTPNNQIFFKKQAIELVFDEWVTLKNQNQIIVSPPLEHGLDVKLKKKTLVLDFDKDEELLENTTYTINLGQSIVDYTVGNPMGNYTYVFSTGSYIDSLSISGKVTDDYTGEALENVIVSLYANLQDSAVYKERPLYFARTDENGRYKLNNIRKDSFNIFAIEDKNLNYFKDQANEKIGFYADPFFLDSNLVKINIGVFETPADLRILSKNQSFGELKLLTNKIVSSIDYDIEGDRNDIKTYFDKDTIFLWHNSPEERNIIIDPQGAADTILLKAVTDSLLTKKKNSFQLLNVSKAKPMSPYDSLLLQFNAPVLSFDESRIAIIDTSMEAIKTRVFQDFNDPRVLKVKASWKESKKHTLEILPGAIETSLGIKNDTLRREFGVNQRKTLGEIVLELDSLNQEEWYLVELILQDQRITRMVKNEKNTTLEFKGLKPGKYTIRLTEDLNKNEKWDAGDIFTRRKSERWILKTLEPLKPNWTLEIKMNGDEFK